MVKTVATSLLENEIFTVVSITPSKSILLTDSNREASETYTKISL